MTARPQPTKVAPWGRRRTCACSPRARSLTRASPPVRALIRRGRQDPVVQEAGRRDRERQGKGLRRRAGGYGRRGRPVRQGGAHGYGRRSLLRHAAAHRGGVCAHASRKLQPRGRNRGVPLASRLAPTADRRVRRRCDGIGHARLCRHLAPQAPLLFALSVAARPKPPPCRSPAHARRPIRPAQGLRKWMEETQPPRGHVAFGVQPFLRSAVGGWLLNATVGARGLRRVLESQGARYEFVVGGVSSITHRLAAPVAGCWMRRRSSASIPTKRAPAAARLPSRTPTYAAVPVYTNGAAHHSPLRSFHPHPPVHTLPNTPFLSRAG